MFPPEAVPAVVRSRRFARGQTDRRKMDTYAAILDALIPVFLLVVIGYIVGRAQFPGPEFWPAAERITYFLLFPALLLHSTATAVVGSLTVAPVITAAVAAILAMVAGLTLLRPAFKTDHSGFTSVFQGSIRFNTYVGFAVVFALLGSEGLVWATVIIAVLIPLVNLLSVSALIMCGREKAGLWRSHFLAVLRTPPLLACLAGVILNISGFMMPVWVGSTLQLFGRASLPLGLLAVGAGLSFAAVRTAGGIVILVAFLKLCVLPFFMWLACNLLHVQPPAMLVAVLFAALPGSASSYILARQLGGDSTLMANIVSVQIVLALITLPLVLGYVWSG